MTADSAVEVSASTSRQEAVSREGNFTDQLLEAKALIDKGHERYRQILTDANRLAELTVGRLPIERPFSNLTTNYTEKGGFGSHFHRTAADIRASTSQTRKGDLVFPDGQSLRMSATERKIIDSNLVKSTEDAGDGSSLVTTDGGSQPIYEEVGRSEEVSADYIRFEDPSHLGRDVVIKNGSVIVREDGTDDEGNHVKEAIASLYENKDDRGRVTFVFGRNPDSSVDIFALVEERLKYFIEHAESVTAQTPQ